MQFKMKNQAEEGHRVQLCKYSHITTLFLLTTLRPFQIQAGSSEQWPPAALSTQND